MDFIFIYLPLTDRPEDVIHQFFYHYDNSWFEDGGSGIASTSSVSRKTLIKTHLKNNGSLVLK